jgi:uncharacterized protein DUF5134
LAHLAVTASGELAFYRHAQPPIRRAGPADAYPPAAAGGLAPAARIPITPGPGDADVSSRAWLAGSFAILMIVIAVYCAARLAISRLQGRNTERDADALHVLMGVAMAGMLEPRLTSVPVTAWRVVFAAAAAWFAWQAVRPGHQAGGARCAHPAAHAVECAAMVYMLLPVGSWSSGHGPGMAMPGMSQGITMGNPALTLVLALFMLGYVLWAIDRFAHLSRTTAPAAARVTFVRGSPQAAQIAPAGPSAAAAAYPHPAGSAVLAPRLAASYKIVMAITMGYMLITML